MNNREEALKAFKEHFAFKDSPIAWSAWKMAWDLAYRSGYNKGLDDAAEFSFIEDDREWHWRKVVLLTDILKLKI